MSTPEENIETLELELQLAEEEARGRDKLVRSPGEVLESFGDVARQGVTGLVEGFAAPVAGVVSGLTKVGTEGYQAVTDPRGFATDIADTIAFPFQSPENGVQTLKETGRAFSGFIPGGATVYSEALQALAPGEEPEKPFASSFAREMGQNLGGLGFVKAISKGGQLATEMLPESVVNFGRNGAVLDSELSKKPGAYAAVQNANQGTTATRAQDLIDTVRYEPIFQQLNPVGGLDTGKLNRAQVGEQYLLKLEDLKGQGLVGKENLVLQADSVLKQRGQVGVDLGNLNLAELDDLIQKDLSTPFTAIDAGAGSGVRGELLNTFNAPTSIINPATGSTFSIPKPHSLPEAIQLVRQIDKKLEQIGAFDRKTLASADESTFANMRARVDALRAARGAINDTIKTQIEGTLGTAQAEQFQTFNDTIGMSIEYGNLGRQFFTESLQGANPLAPNSLNNNVRGGKVTSLETYAPEMTQFGKEYGALNRDSKAISRMQAIIGYRNNPPSRVLPRNLDILSSNPENVALIGTAAAQLGILATPDQFQMAPPQIKKGVVESLVQAIPELFEAAPNNYPSFWNGRLWSPIDIMDRASEVAGAEKSRVPVSKKAEAIGALHDGGRYVEVTPSVPKPVAMPQTGMDMGSFGAAFSGIPSPVTMNTANTGETDAIRMMNQLQKSESERDPY